MADRVKRKTVILSGPDFLVGYYGRHSTLYKFSGACDISRAGGTGRGVLLPCLDGDSQCVFMGRTHGRELCPGINRAFMSARLREEHLRDSWPIAMAGAQAFTCSALPECCWGFS